MSEHLTAFEWALAQYLGAGVAACYRGFRIFNDPASEVPGGGMNLPTPPVVARPSYLS